jgi:hypothetical protein
MVEKKTPVKKTVAKKPVAKKTATKSAPADKTPKDIATEKNEPWVSVLSVELDPDNIGNGAFELDWNDKFITNLVRAGYKGKDDVQMVDQWFQDVCRNVLAENYEQWVVNQPNAGRTNNKEDLGGGKTSVS